MTYQLAECIANKRSHGWSLTLDVFCNINKPCFPLIIIESSIYDEGVLSKGFMSEGVLSGGGFGQHVFHYYRGGVIVLCTRTHSTLPK